MEASLNRAFIQEQKHMEKMKRKEKEQQERAAAAALNPYKRPEAKKAVRKLTATADRRRDQKRAKAEAEGEEEEEVQIDVYDDNGQKMLFSRAVEEIQVFLKHHGSEATLGEVRRGTGVDPEQSLDFLDALRRNPSIEAVGLASGERLKYAPLLGLVNRGSLAHLLSRATPGSGETEAVLRSQLAAAETYAGIDVDLEELLAQRRCVRLDLSDRSKRDYVLFAAPPGRPAIEELRSLWREVRVPQGPALEDALLARKLRTPAEIAARADRKAAVHRKNKELADKPKQRKTGAIRKWANVHLGNAEELEDLFAKPT